MRRGRVLILFALVLISGVVALYLLLGRGGGGTGGELTTPEGPGLPTDVTMIVVAAQDISRGAVIPENGVTLAPWPRDNVVETMIENDLSVVIGKYARQEIARGVPITTNMITRRAGDLLGTGSEAAIAIPPGYTALSVPMNRLSGVAYALEAGDQVDVLITLLMLDIDPDFQTALPNESLILISPDGFVLTAMVCREFKQGERGPECVNAEPVAVGRVDVEETTAQPLYSHPTEDQRPRLVTQRLVQNATVLHVGDFTREEAQVAPVQVPQGAGAPEPSGQVQPVQVEARPPDIITLIVTPQDALAINWAIRAGATLSFTLRSPDDATETETSSVTLQYLVQSYNITVPSRLPYGLTPRLEAVIDPALPNDGPQPTPSP
jgi:Flp pilus assembly protein CpaB